MAATGKFEIFESAVDYAAKASWTERKATGWVRTEGIPSVRIHSSLEKVHLAGGWVRRNVEGEPILENRVLYVLTKETSEWGIQARFACGSVASWEDGSGEEAREFVEVFLDAMRNGNPSECATMVHDNVIAVVGRKVTRYAANLHGLRALSWILPSDYTSSEVRTIHDGAIGANVAVTLQYRNKGSMRIMALVAKNEDSLKLLAVSVI